MIKIVGSFKANDWAHWKSGFDNHAEAIKNSSHKQETSVMIVCSN